MDHDLEKLTREHWAKWRADLFPGLRPEARKNFFRIVERAITEDVRFVSLEDIEAGAVAPVQALDGPLLCSNFLGLEAAAQHQRQQPARSSTHRNVRGQRSGSRRLRRSPLPHRVARVRRAANPDGAIDRQRAC